MNDELLTMQDVIKILKSSRSTVYRWISLDLLPKPAKIKSKLLFKKSELIKALQKHGLAIS